MHDLATLERLNHEFHDRHATVPTVANSHEESMTDLRRTLSTLLNEAGGVAEDLDILARSLQKACDRAYRILDRLDHGGR